MEKIPTKSNNIPPNGPLSTSIQNQNYMTLSTLRIHDPQTNPLKYTQHTNPEPILNYLTSTYNITHSYFPSLVTCPTNVNTYHSPFPRDVIFASLGPTFIHKCTRNGLVHPPNLELTQKAIHWARLATKENPQTITIVIAPDDKWYENYTPQTTQFRDTHVIAYIPEPTILPKLNQKSRIEPLRLNILCIHHQNNPLNTTPPHTPLPQILQKLNIPNCYTNIPQPTPPNTTVNKHKGWKKAPNPPLACTIINKTPPSPPTHLTKT